MFCPSCGHDLEEKPRQPGGDPRGGEVPPESVAAPQEPEDRWVSLADVVGSDRIPEAAAAVLGSALDLMAASGDIGERNRWEGLEYLAAEWIAGASYSDDR